MANGSSREIVDILQCGEGRDLTDDSGEQAFRLLGEVSIKHKLALVFCDAQKPKEGYSATISLDHFVARLR